MEDLLIDPTKKTPCVAFYTTGKLSLTGNSLPENANEFFDPVIDWITHLKAEEVDFDVNIEYMNSASANRIMNMFKLLDNNQSIKHIKINWFYEEGDIDNYETGEILMNLLKRIEFNLVQQS